MVGARGIGIGHRKGGSEKTMLSPVAVTAIGQEDECNWPVVENPPRCPYPDSEIDIHVLPTFNVEGWHSQPAPVCQI